MLLKKFLQAQCCFRDMSEALVEEIAAAMRVEDYADGHVFVYQDKQAKALHLLVEGKVSASRYGPSGKPHTLKVYQAGEFFGLESLSDGHPVSASYAADGEVKVASLPFSAYMLLFQPDSEIGCAFQYVIAAQLARDLHDRHDSLRQTLRQLYALDGATGG